jgi:hypothetical protein
VIVWESISEHCFRRPLVSFEIIVVSVGVVRMSGGIVVTSGKIFR